MKLDQSLVFSDKQAVTLVQLNASTSVVDTLLAGDAIAEPMNLIVSVAVAPTSAGAATVQFTLQTSDDEAFGTSDTLVQTAALDYTTLTAGKRVIQAPIPLGIKRYLRVAYTIGVAALTAGKFTAFLTNDMDRPFDVQ